MSIDLYFANVGSGKTTLLAKIANSKKYQKKYDMIFSNVPIANTYKLDIKKDLGVYNIENALILVDEGAIEFDNNIKLPEVQKYYFRMHRHYNCDIIVVSQSYEDISIILRRLYRHIYVLDKLWFGLSKAKRINKYIDIDETTHQITEFYAYVPFPLSLITNKTFYRPNYYKYFNSFDKIELKPKEFEKWHSEVEEKKNDKILLLNYIKGIKNIKTSKKIRIPYKKDDMDYKEDEVI